MLAILYLLVLVLQAFRAPVSPGPPSSILLQRSQPTPEAAAVNSGSASPDTKLTSHDAYLAYAQANIGPLLMVTVCINIPACVRQC